MDISAAAVAVAATVLIHQTSSYVQMLSAGSLHLSVDPTIMTKCIQLLQPFLMLTTSTSEQQGQLWYINSIVTYDVLCGTLNRTHSLTFHMHILIKKIQNRVKLIFPLINSYTFHNALLPLEFLPLSSILIYHPL